MTVTIPGDFDLQKIAASGQAFRIAQTPQGWRFLAGDKLLYLQPGSGDTYTASCTPEEWQGFWHRYFDLNRNYAAIRAAVPKQDAYLCAAARAGAGIRILRQDAWEMLVTFIISQRKNIPAIQACVETLCTRYGAPLLVLAAGAGALWPFRHQLTAKAIAAFSPRQTVLAASFLVGLYALKSLSVCFPMSALTAAGGLLFPFPLALAVNLCGTGVAQTIPFFLGRREQGGLEALAERIPRVAGVCRAQAENPWLSVFLLRLAGASPGDVVSLYLGASGTPYGTYLSAGLLGGLPRIACATVLGGALWQPGSGRFWLSLAAGGALTALSGVIWLLWRRRRRA